MVWWMVMNCFETNRRMGNENHVLNISGVASFINIHGQNTSMGNNEAIGFPRIFVYFHSLALSYFYPFWVEGGSNIVCIATYAQTQNHSSSDSNHGTMPSPSDTSTASETWTTCFTSIDGSIPSCWYSSCPIGCNACSNWAGVSSSSFWPTVPERKQKQIRKRDYYDNKEYESRLGQASENKLSYLAKFLLDKFPSID